MSKQALGETDICDRFITPALLQAGWLREQALRERAFTGGRIKVQERLVAGAGRGHQHRIDTQL
jgi:type I restriction enzyme R subunit